MQIGSYKLTHRVGVGAMGIVFRAVDSSGHLVALKMIGSIAQIQATVYANRQVKNASAFDLRRRMMFVREARLAMGLNHPNIAQVHDYGQHEGLLYIVMEFLEGRPMDKVIPIGAAIPIPSRLSLIRQLCDALSHAHGQGIIHRDIKPANCFILQDSVLKVLDFGIAARPDEQVGRLPVAGTPAYMAPELFDPTPRFTAATDIWAAGVTLFQLLTGSLPFAGRSLQELSWNIIHSPSPRLPDSFPHARELGRILDIALDKDAGRRFTSAREFADALSAVETVAEGVAGGGTENRNSDQPWWATRIVQESAITSPLPESGGTAISMISGGVKARRGGHAVRFAEYNAKIRRPAMIGILLAVSYAIFSMFGGNGYASLAQWAWTIAGYGAGLVVPVLLLISILLAGLVFYERLARPPRCRRCRALMQHGEEVTAFAYSKVSWRHASSDCLAALRENLWADAPKLLSMHGELVPPAFDAKTAYPPLRLHLDFYACLCGDKMAVLTTEDRIGRTWSPREEFTGAYKSQNPSEAGPSGAQRVLGAFRVVGRAARQVVQPVRVRFAWIMLMSGILIAFEYYPQFPIILGWKNSRVPIAFQEVPPGVMECSAVHRYLWKFATDHVLTFDDVIYCNGNIFKFNGILPAPAKVSADRWGRPIRTTHNFIVRVEVTKDRWGRLTTQPVTPVFTAQYSVTGKYDPDAEAKNRSNAEKNGERNWQQEIKEWERFYKSQSRLTAAGNPAMYPAPRSRIVITSIPAGLVVLVDGARVVTPKTYTWDLGSYHSLAVTSENQTVAAGNGSSRGVYSGGRWDFGSRESSGRVHINWSAIPFPLTYTAKFALVSGSNTQESAKGHVPGSPTSP